MIPESFIADRPTSLRRRPGYGVIARYRDWLPVSDSDPVITLGEGGTPLVAAEKLSEHPALRDLDQGRGRQSDRFIQGPRHDSCAQCRRRAGCAGRGLRLDRQYLCVGRCVRGEGGPVHHRAAARLAGLRPASSRRQSCMVPRWCKSTATSTTAWNSPASSPMSTRSRSSIRSTRTGSRVRRLRRLK